MQDNAQSILDRLRNKAVSNGKSYQVILQLFCQEEFLRRLGKSKFSNNLVLKGGLLLYCLSGFESRPTMDIDFLLRNHSNALIDVENMIKEIISSDRDNEVMAFEIKSIKPIAEHREYNGVRAKIIGKIKNTRTPFDIDFGVGDIIIPKSEIRKIPTQLENFEEPEINTYSLESTIAEKFDAIILRMELGSRMKDYYDIYYLAHTYKFDSRKLQEAIFETLQNRGTAYEKDTLNKVNEFSNNNQMLIKWNHFIGEMDGSLNFSETLNTINAFIGPVFDAILEEKEAFGMWNPEKQKYEEYGN